jgi:hypothetical protein
MVTMGKNNEASRAKQLIAGANKRFPNASQTLTVGGATYTVTALTTLFQRLVDLREAVDQAKAAAQTRRRSALRDTGTCHCCTSGRRPHCRRTSST